MAGMTFTEGSGLQNSIFGKSQEPIKLFLEKRGEAFEQQSILDKIFVMETSNSYGEKLTTMTGMDGFKPVGESGETPRDMMQEGFSKYLEHVTWKDSFVISQEMVEDSKLMDLRDKPAGFVTAYYRTRERYGAALLGGAIAGKTSIDFMGWKFDTTTADKKALFAKDHGSAIKENKKVQSNQFADAFSVDALGAMETAMQDFRGDGDEILDVVPDTIVIGNDWKLKKDVFAAIGADKDPNSANNGFNYQFGRWNVIIWPYLNQYITKGTSPWILMSSQYNKDYRGALWLDRVKLAVNSYIDENTHDNVWSGRARFVAGFNDWRAFAVGGVTGGTQLITA